MAGASPVARAFRAARQAATSADGLASASESGAVIEPAGVAGTSTLVGFVHGLSGCGSSAFGAAARPGAAAIITAAVVIADINAVLCVLRARRNGVRSARECMSFPPQEVRTGDPSGHQWHTIRRDVPPNARDMRSGISPAASARQTGPNHPDHPAVRAELMVLLPLIGDTLTETL
ncbi:hypothetical protein SAM23877_5877 [Streptomyces ambofaciens ATCC 23877]|uniref:Uncharacterized protein n=1 Tax=Streptomyces ambofaciens (strain ATCC 23877 / 3486 / DSM 40053 / JCM 4204 / NBRC 12836 / NRRL B-2516) TaxID=278992 RepID=A0A0K2B1D6_STRA7|nr:hypothetical protein SAM23877_5877 [Streptomyces ambofaciens ATCC 23877]